MSAPTLQSVSGMNDVLPEAVAAWQHLESTLRELLRSYGYAELRTPVVEHTALFKRAIGEFTDVVEKEMYTFTDQGGDSLTLRPEATAGIMRAAIEHGMLRGQRHKLWCTGPMFRRERPQKGRYRQFHQVNVEALGFAGPDVDAELIALAARMWRTLGITRVRLEINSLGTPEARRSYREHLVAYFRAHEAVLDEDSRRRLQGNPLRILDSKNPQMQALIAGAPMLTEHLDPESQAHFAELGAMLRAVGIEFTVNPRLVRGLDYYTRTVFEWVTDALGAQNAVCSGGRYDGLIAQLGGEATPGVGFALGCERVIELMQLERAGPPPPPPDAYVIVGGAGAQSAAMALIERLRDALPGRRFELNLGGGNMKAQFRRADRSGARLALVLGEDELARGALALKPLREDGGQSEVTLADAARAIEAALGG